MLRLLGLMTAIVVAGASAQATTLKFDLTGIYYVKNRAGVSKERKINVESLNEDLKEAGVDGLPEEVVVNQNAKPYGKVLLKRIEAAKAAMKIDYRFVIDNGYLYEFPTICYQGQASDVPSILKAMSGTFLNNTQGILAIRYGSRTIAYVDHFKSESALKKNYEGSGADKEIRTWLRFNESSKNVLVMSDLGHQGDGTELYTTVIKPCR